VVEGGKDTIANIYYDLKESIPVVIIGVSKPKTKNILITNKSI
jgi:diphthamide synthase (EF-2-diphthine--ammonia ligase)